MPKGIYQRRPKPICSVDGCETVALARGWCNAHYKRWWRYRDLTADLRKNPPPRAPTPLADLFWHLVDKRGPDDCWPWQGSLYVGYGRIKDGQRGRVGAHRVSWELHHGPIPDGLWVLHRCDNPPCVNPAHLFLGTPGDNVRDMHAKGRWSRRATRPAQSPAAQPSQSAADPPD